MTSAVPLVVEGLVTGEDVADGGDDARQQLLHRVHHPVLLRSQVRSVPAAPPPSQACRPVTPISVIASAAAAAAIISVEGGGGAPLGRVVGVGDAAEVVGQLVVEEVAEGGHVHRLLLAQQLLHCHRLEVGVDPHLKKGGVLYYIILYYNIFISALIASLELMSTVRMRVQRTGFDACYPWAAGP